MEEAAIPTASQFKLSSRVSRIAKKHGVASGCTCREKKPSHPEMHLRRPIISNMLDLITFDFLGQFCTEEVYPIGIACLMKPLHGQARNVDERDQDA